MSRWAELGCLLAVLALGIGLRLHHLSDRYIIDFHDFRQADTAAFSRNYLATSLNPAETRIDRYPCTHRSKDFGLVESELPLVAWLASLPLAALGIDYPPPVYLRSVSVLFFLFTCLYLYALVGRLSGSAAQAAASVLALSLFPYAIYFTRTVQPDGPALFFSTAVLFHLLVWAEEERRAHLIVSGLLMACLLLLKVSNLFLLLPALFLVAQVRGVRGCLKPWLPVWLLIGLAPPAAWYLYAHAYPWTFGIWPDREQSKFASVQALLDPSVWKILSERLLFDILTLGGIVLVAAGLTRIGADRTIRLAAVWTAGVVAFVVLAIKGHRIHLYYQLPLALPAAVLAGAGMLAFWRQAGWGRMLLAVVAAVHLATLAHTFERRGWPPDKMGYYTPHLDAIEGIELLKTHVRPGERFVSSDLDPVLYYNANRQGWFESGRTAERFLACMGGDVDALLLDAKAEARLLADPRERERLLGAVGKVGGGKYYALYRRKATP